MWSGDGTNPTVGSEQGWLESPRPAKAVHDLWVLPVHSTGSGTGIAEMQGSLVGTV